MQSSDVDRPSRAQWIAVAIVSPLVGALLALSLVTSLAFAAFVGLQLVLAASAVVIIRQRRRLSASIVESALVALVIEAWLLWLFIQPAYR